MDDKEHTLDLTSNNTITMAVDDKPLIVMTKDKFKYKDEEIDDVHGVYNAFVDFFTKMEFKTDISMHSDVIIDYLRCLRTNEHEEIDKDKCRAIIDKLSTLRKELNVCGNLANHNGKVKLLEIIRTDKTLTLATFGIIASTSSRNSYAFVSHYSHMYSDKTSTKFIYDIPSNKDPDEYHMVLNGTVIIPLIKSIAELVHTENNSIHWMISELINTAYIEKRLITNKEIDDLVSVLETDPR